MKCKCGHEVSTRFCPCCGRENESPLTQLLAHCDGMVISSHTRTTRLKDNQPSDAAESYNKRRSKNCIESAERAEEKWKRWSNALRDIMPQETKAP